MKKFCIFIFTLIVFFEFATIHPFALSAQSAVVIDAVSGRVLYEHNKDEKRGMASTTKIMTAICALEYGDMEKMVTVSPTASGVEGSSMYLKKGEKISMTDLVYGLMLVSGNDAATAIAEAVSGSVEKFAVLMNKKAAEIGAYNTSFTNPHGLADKNHYTTAHDLAKITAYAMQNPIFCEVALTKNKTLPSTDVSNARTLINHNKFLSMYEGCVGVKTGFTKATGRCLVTAVEKNDMRLICVTLNASNDWNDHKELYNLTFDTFAPYEIKKKDEVIALADVKKGAVKNVNLVCADDAHIPIKDGEDRNINVTAEVFEDIEAPIKKGDILGKIKVGINGEVCGEFPIFAAENVELKKVVFNQIKNDWSITLKKVFYMWITSLI